MAQLNFDASTVAPQEAFDPIPAGWYPAQIVESEMKAGSKPGSSYLAITLQIMGGDFNCNPWSPVYRTLLGAGFVDAYRAAGHADSVKSSTFHGFQGVNYFALE